MEPVLFLYMEIRYSEYGDKTLQVGTSLEVSEEKVVSCLRMSLVQLYNGMFGCMSNLFKLFVTDTLLIIKTSFFLKLAQVLGKEVSQT